MHSEAPRPTKELFGKQAYLVVHMADFSVREGDPSTVIMYVILKTKKPALACQYCPSCKLALPQRQSASSQVHCRMYGTSSYYEKYELYSLLSSPPHTYIIKEHVAECEFGEVQCKMCGGHVQRRSLQAHMKTSCPMRPELCVHCGKDIPFQQTQVCYSTDALYCYPVHANFIGVQTKVSFWTVSVELEVYTLLS